MVKSEDNKIQSDPSKSIPTTSSCRKRKFKGVRMRSWGSWVSEIRAPNQKTRIWLGSYSTPEAAARAYDAALLCLKGSSANLNFPITSTPFIPDTIMSPKSIQRVAAAAANNNYNNATTPTSPTTPSTPITNPTTPSTPSSILPSTPSQSTSSSSSNHNDNDHHDVSLIPYWPNYTTTYISEEPIRPLVDPWIDFDGLQSPKYVDQMLNACSMYAPPTTIEDFYYDESADIRLWSFC